MPGLLLHMGAQMQCSHQAPVPIFPNQTQVYVSGQLVATTNDLLLLPAPPACPWQVPFGTGTKPQPCVKIQWANVSTKVFIHGTPVLLQALPGTGPGNGVGQSAEQIPQGPPFIGKMQTRVFGK